MKLKTLRQISKIKSISMAVRKPRKRRLSVSVMQYRLFGGPLDGEEIAMQAFVLGTLPFSLHGQSGRYDSKNQWVKDELS